MNESNLTKLTENVEHCVFCDDPTPYSKDTPVDMRDHYVEGAGQLCKKCYDKVFNTPE